MTINKQFNLLSVLLWNLINVHALENETKNLLINRNQNLLIMRLTYLIQVTKTQK